MGKPFQCATEAVPVFSAQSEKNLQDVRRFDNAMGRNDFHPNRRARRRKRRSWAFQRERNCCELKMGGRNQVQRSSSFAGDVC